MWTNDPAHNGTYVPPVSGLAEPYRVPDVGGWRLPLDGGLPGRTLGKRGDDLRFLAGEGGLPLEVRPCCADHSWWL